MSADNSIRGRCLINGDQQVEFIYILLPSFLSQSSWCRQHNNLLDETMARLKFSASMQILWLLAWMVGSGRGLSVCPCSSLPKLPSKRNLTRRMTLTTFFDARLFRDFMVVKKDRSALTQEWKDSSIVVVKKTQLLRLSITSEKHGGFSVRCCQNSFSNKNKGVTYTFNYGGIDMIILVSNNNKKRANNGYRETCFVTSGLVGWDGASWAM